MSVSHCPLCPLIFQFRTEVEDHLRNDHRSRAEEEADLGKELEGAPHELTWLRLRALQSAASDPSVSLLLDTAPGAMMTSLDAARLHRLARKARQRLSLEVRGGDLSHLEHRLARAVAAAEGGPTDCGIAVLVSARQLAIVRLPLEPKERVVVDPTFATRDLFDALQSFPVYRVVVLDPGAPRLFEGSAHSLAEITEDTGVLATGALPASRLWGIGRAVTGRVESLTPRLHRLQATVDMTDELLDMRSDATAVLPLVIVGTARVVSLFRRRSRHEPDVIGHVRHIQRRPSVHEIQMLVAPAVESLRRRCADERVAQLERAESKQALAWGIESALRAVLAGQVERLWVGRDYMVPARALGRDGALQIVDDPETPGVVDDIVDDLIEIAVSKGTPSDIVDLNASDPGRACPDRAEGGVAVQIRPAAAGPSMTPSTTAA